ncbi:hypothetical protein [Kochikohdavirus PBEF19]|uniref:Uncharacterized protein n=1 Tax=Enterococcus phage PBEF129 TaxID=2696337 RepID=A0A7T3JEL3_9CAUD|nr:hypothetical protein [Enterococcus phage PBEF129]
MYSTEGVAWYFKSSNKFSQPCGNAPKLRLLITCTLYEVGLLLRGGFVIEIGNASAEEIKLYCATSSGTSGENCGRNIGLLKLSLIAMQAVCGNLSKRTIS